jgi:hypothetical protein
MTARRGLGPQRGGQDPSLTPLFRVRRPESARAATPSETGQRRPLLAPHPPVGPPGAPSAPGHVSAAGGRRAPPYGGDVELELAARQPAHHLHVGENGGANAGKLRGATIEMLPSEGVSC